ncbi:MFS transporter [Hydrogenophaga sp. BPS33]|uniref:MFS transporter n=1 Tax=Hydrogenophaga sp. BPS33 TaxID=2651974 RepID=UPI00131FFEBA|nr:MFS transporter [Hydrogenophaga sp. BPS33]QHE85572.1 multidrug efflux MFS transporter [Hydrogenophaga sp. BPS33]
MSNRLLPLTVGLAFFMEQLDSTIIAPAIPDIAAELGVAPLSLNLTMTVYLLCSITFIPAGDRLASRFGTRTVFQWAIVLFALSSVMCALAQNLSMLVAARAVQGASAALMVPVGRTSIVHVTPKPQLVNALAWMITMAMLGPMLGPPLGGLITTWLSWHWIFLINVPIALLCFIGAARSLPQIRQPSDGRFDLLSWLLLGGTLGSAIVVLEGLRVQHMDQLVWLLPTGLLALAYVWRNHRATLPMLDFSLLRVPTFAASFWSGSLLRMGFGSLPFLLPLMLQIGLGYSPVQSGLVLLASGLVAMLTKTQTTTILRRWGFRRVMLVNGALCVLGLLVCALFRPYWGLGVIALTVCCVGFVRAIQFNAVTAIAYAELPPARIGAATTLNTMVWQMAIMFGISLSSVVVTLATRAAGRAQAVPLDFSIAFVILAFVGALAIPACWRLRTDAGSQLSGHQG